MLRFKQYIKEAFISEATISHFSHLGLDPNNPEHKDMVDAYNNGLNHPQNKIKAKPNQIKTFDQLKNTVAPHVAAIQQKRQEDAEDKEAFANKEAELVHHDPSTGVKVFKVRSGKGCSAVGGDTKWCVANRKTGSEAMEGYDPEGEYSHVIHTPEKGNLSKIGIIGVKPGEKHSDGVGGNFQDKGNNTVSDEHWDMLRKKYNLDNVKALHGIRGLHNSEVDNLLKNPSDSTKNPNTSTEDLDIIAKNHSHNPKIREEILNHKNSGNNALRYVADNSTDPETHKTIINHKNVDDTALASVVVKSHNPEIHRAILNHKAVGGKALSAIAKKSNDPEIHRAILNHEKVGDHTLAEIAYNSNHEEIQREILKHKNVGDRALSAVAGNSDNTEIHRAILNHENTGDGALSSVAWKSDDPDIHRAIVNHSKADSEALSSVAWKSDDPDIHRAIANHSKAGDETLAGLADRSKDPDIYRVILNHKNVGDQALSTVAENLDDLETHKNIINHKNAGPWTLANLGYRYKTPPDKESISKAIDAHIRSKKGNPYQLESFFKCV